jgi:hypothetical protein
MDIQAALRQEESKLQKQLDAVRAAMKILRGGVSSNTKPTENKRVMSAAARAKISKATKARWARFRAEKAKKGKK